MGSIFTTLPDKYNKRDIDGRLVKYPQYIQFQPGTVVSIIAGEDCESYRGGRQQDQNNNKVGSIIAKPYFTKEGVGRSGMMGEEHRYYPLMRGMQDIPTVNDPVLLCTFGGINYYMGPLNVNCHPNFNADPMKSKDTPLTSTANKSLLAGDRYASDPMFITHNVNRLHKKINKRLDEPLKADYDDLTEEEQKANVSSVGHGDMVFEGRHGNSIRIGSRNINPYIYMSNGRAPGNIVESTLDSNLFALLDRGTIREHFPWDKKYGDEQAETEEDLEHESYPFTLADGDETEMESDKIYSSISKTFAQPLGYGNTFDGETIDIDPVINEYSGSQAFLTSDRIVINARQNEMFSNLETGQQAGCILMSAGSYMHFGSANTITFSTSNNMLMNISRDTTINSTTEFNVNCKTVNLDGSTRINLGDPLKGHVMQPVAKGTTLVWLLKTLAEDLGSMCDRTAAAIEGAPKRGASIRIMGDMKKLFQAWRDDIDSCLSDKVYTK